MAKAEQPRRIGLDLGEKSLSALVLRPDGQLSASIGELNDQTGLESAIAALYAGPSAGELVVTSSRGFSALKSPPRIALLVTEGFEDLLRVRDAPLADLAPLLGLRPSDLCPRERVIGVPERLQADGGIVKPLTAATLEALQKQLLALDVSAIAVVLLHSHQNDAHERTIAEALASLGLPISLSSALLRVPDERRRAGPTLLDASLAADHQKTRAALAKSAGRLLFGDSAGDVTLPAQASPIGQLFSAIASGLRGAQRIAAGHGMSRFLALHLVDSCAALALHDPALLAASASGTGRGLEPWACVPAQELRVVPIAAGQTAAELEPALLAALSAITLDRGHDPAEYPLLCYGRRLPPTLAQGLADRLGVASLLIPPSPSLVAAYGALCAPVVSARRELLVADASSAQQTGQIVATLSALARRLREELGQAGYATSSYLLGLDWLAEMRYRGQESHSLLLTGLGDGSPASSGDTDLVVRFCAEHKRRYGFVLAECPVEIVALRVRLSIPLATPSYSELQRLKDPGDFA